MLLCARKMDWKNSKADQYSWNTYSSYSRYQLRGIEEEDAKEIVTAWAALGKKGLGKLSDLSIPEATRKLCLSAKDEMDKGDSDEGALLGAMLTARYGEELDEHVRNMLLRLREIKLQKSKGTTLLDVYAYIAAMHSEGLDLLYKEVIAQVYALRTGDVRKYILVPLGDEAATAVNGEVVYTRHIFIARAARKIMEDEFDYDFNEIFIELSKAAMDVINEVGVKPEYVAWKYLGDHFIEKNNWLAFELYRNVLEKSPKDPQMTVHLSGKYRESEIIRKHWHYLRMKRKKLITVRFSVNGLWWKQMWDKKQKVCVSPRYRYQMKSQQRRWIKKQPVKTYMQSLIHSVNCIHRIVMLTINGRLCRRSGLAR